jgi:hypothetical protein
MALQLPWHSAFRSKSGALLGIYRIEGREVLVTLGVERAMALARAPRCHPAVLVFPGWDVASESAA